MMESSAETPPSVIGQTKIAVSPPTISPPTPVYRFAYPSDHWTRHELQQMSSFYPDVVAANGQPAKQRGPPRHQTPVYTKQRGLPRTISFGVKSAMRPTSVTRPVPIEPLKASTGLPWGNLPNLNYVKKLVN
jgi:hypothetical protein